ncbi:MAG: menE [Acidimicrobiales bacterium]|nr:menE [Acidimicrobiales bacterium]
MSRRGGRVGQAGRVPDLVAIDLPGGPAFVAALQRIWDAGDAALPVDQRLPPPARASLLDAMAPAAIVTSADDPADRHAVTGVEPVPTEAGDALVVATSGTTGAPRGVVLTHEAVRAHGEAVHERLGVDPGRDRWLACLPLAHVGGLGVVTRALVTGTPLDVVPAFDAAAVAAAPVDLGTTLVSLVPTALDRVDTAAFRWVVLGGAADPGRRDANVIRTYGLTETGGGVVYDGTPLAGIEVRLVDGEVHLRGRSLLRAYRDGTAALDRDGWFATGDLGAWDADGRLVVHGRRGDLIVTGGENVWPTAVEDALRAHAGVADVAVAGRPDREWGQRVVAWVVPVDAHRPPSLDALRDQVRQRLPAFAAPRELVLVAELARTALGKVRRDALTGDPGASDGPSAR